VTELHVLVPDDIAERLHAEATTRGVTDDQLAAQALDSFLRTEVEQPRRVPSFIGLGDAPESFDVQRAEEQLEDEGFVASSS
jgi:hypothetical protein